jgi:hypothetical protein
VHVLYSSGRLEASFTLSPDAWNVRFVKYSALLSDAVDEGLSKLGRLPKDAVYEALKTDFSMRRKDIPTRFSEFSSILLENIGPVAKPVLEYVVDRFSYGIGTESLSSIDLGESIKRVDMILKGSLTLPEGSNHASRTVSVPAKGETIDCTRLGVPLTDNELDLLKTNHSVVASAAPQGTHSRKSGRMRNQRCCKVNSNT